MPSYVAQTLGAFARAREAFGLYRIHSSGVPQRVYQLIRKLDQATVTVEEMTGLRLEGLKMLDIGPGQLMDQMAYFSCHNEVVGIDLDLVPQGPSPMQYLRMLRSNGWVRTFKTVARKSMGLDARYHAELARQLGVRSLGPFRILAMDATEMRFPAGSFDFVYSFSVFEHLANPGAVLAQVARVLRGGGVAYLSLHPYTSETGAHDVRLLSGRRGGIPYWAHLRPRFSGQIHSNSYLNRLRLGEWREIFSRHLPGAQFISHQFHQAELGRELEVIRAGGELLEYDRDELLTGEFVAVWQKPTERLRA